MNTPGLSADARSRIEAAVRQHPAVLEAVVLPRAAAFVAYAVTTRAIARSELSAIDGELVVVPVTALPRDATGAIDSAALLALPVLDDHVADEATRRLSAQGASEAAAWIEPAEIRSPAPISARAATQAPRPLVPDPAPSSLSDGGPWTLPPGAPRTLVEAFERTVAQFPGRGIVHVDTDGETFQSYPELWAAARRVVSALRAADVGAYRGASHEVRTVVIQSASTRDHVTLFWGCVLAGMRPVAVAPPARYDDESSSAKLRQVLEVLGDPPIIASPALEAPLAQLPGRARVIAIDEAAWPEADDLFRPGPDDVLFLQLTSGSTSAPKSVMETSSRVIAHVHATRALVGYSADDVVLNWLPFDHVVPILTCHLRATYLGNTQVLVRPQLVLSEPLLWLDLIERHRVTDTWAPNFGFKILADALAARGAGRRWDLSSVARMMNAGELVTATAIESLLARASAFGLSAQAMQPAFGMAELATCMTYRQGYDRRTCVREVRRSSVGGRLEIPAVGDDDAVSFVDLGPPMAGVAIRIVAPDGTVLPEGVVGGLQVKGPVVTPGYFANAKATREALAADGWFDTGDLGFVHGGALTVTGRAKEIVIVRGVHYACHEIEQTVQAVQGVEPTCVAAASAHVKSDGTDGLAIFFSPRDASVDAASTAALIKRQVAHAIGLTPHWVVAIDRPLFPKTTSGKIQRIKLRSDLEAGRYQDSSPGASAAREAEHLPYFANVWMPSAPSGARTPGPVLVVSAPGDGLDLPGAHAALLGGRLDAARLDREIAKASGGGALDLVVVLPEVDSARTPDALDGALASTAWPVLAILQAAQRADVRGVFVIASGAQPARAGDRVVAEQAATAALIRAAAAELARTCRHVDAPAVERRAAILAELAIDDDEPEVAYRSGARLTPRLELHAGASAPSSSGAWTLVTGASGPVGVEVVRHLASRGADVLAIGRRALEPDHPLAAPNPRVRYRAVDVTDVAALERAVAEVSRELGQPLGAVHHLAARIDERPIEAESAEALRETVHGKAAGALAVLRMLDLHPAASLTMFSSITTYAGGQGVTAYAWGNRFVEALALEASQTRSAHAIAWSAWEGSAAAGDERKDALRARGFRVLAGDAALAALDRCSSLAVPVAAVGFEATSPHVSRRIAGFCRPASRLAAAVVGGPARVELTNRFGTPVSCEARGVASVPRASEGAADIQALRRALSGRAPLVSPRDDRERALAAVWSQTLSLDAVGVHDNLFDVGGNSLLAAQVLGLIQARVSAEVTLVEIYRYPTIAALAAWLGGDRPSRAPAQTQSRDALQRRRARVQS